MDTKKYLMTNMLVLFPLRGSTLVIFFLTILFSGIFYPASAQDFYVSYNHSEHVRHSDIGIMFPETDLDTYKKHQVDVVAWGHQIPWPGPGKILKYQNKISAAANVGVRIYAVDLALLQEGKRYLAKLIGRWNLDAFKDLNQVDTGKSNLQELKKIKEHAVLDVDGNLVGVPWLISKKFVPMACVNDPGYTRHLFDKVEWLMKVQANALHFDEPLMGSTGIFAKNPGCFCKRCCAAFRVHLEKQPESLWKKYGIKTLEGFNYRRFVKSHKIHPKKSPLWDEFEQFQILSAAELFKKLRDHARATSAGPILFSANAPPGIWHKLPFIPLIDYSSAEIAHKTDRLPLEIQDWPMLYYKMADALKVPVFSTALGSDWQRMHNDPHPLLVCAWIAQAYVHGHQMMLPVSVWEPEGLFQFKSDKYLKLAKWIKEVGHLLDGFAPISDTALVVNLDSLRYHRNIVKIVQLCSQLAERNVNYHMVIRGAALYEADIEPSGFKGARQAVVFRPEYFSNRDIKRIRQYSGKKDIFNIESGPISKSQLQSFHSSIKILNEKDVYILPRIKNGKDDTTIVMHLLNRDYDASKKTMRLKGTLTIRFDGSLSQGNVLHRAFFHQPTLHGEVSETRINNIVELPLTKIRDEYEVVIPQLELWGIIELRVI